MGPSRPLCSFGFIFAVIRALQEALSHCIQDLTQLTHKQQLAQGGITASLHISANSMGQEMLPGTPKDNDMPQKENRRK